MRGICHGVRARHVHDDAETWAECAWNVLFGRDKWYYWYNKIQLNHFIFHFYVFFMHWMIYACRSFCYLEPLKSQAVFAKPRENSKALLLKGRQSLEHDKDKGLHCPSLPRNLVSRLSLLVAMYAFYGLHFSKYVYKYLEKKSIKHFLEFLFQFVHSLQNHLKCLDWDVVSRWFNHV